MNKSILITGSTDGIGKLAAIKLAQVGHTIYLHGRRQEKLDQVIAEIRALVPQVEIKGLVADFSDLQAVQQMADRINHEIPKLDILINNAGVFKSPVDTNKNGLDIRFVVNYFAPYLLTNEILPLLRDSAAPRILNLSSAAQAPVSLNALQGKSSLSVQEAYAQSKLAITMWSFHLADQAPNIPVIAVNPGSLLNTNMVKEAYGRFWSSADKGGDILYDLAIAEEYQGITKQYFDNDSGAFAKAHPEAYNQAKIQQLIEHTEDLLKTL